MTVEAPEHHERRLAFWRRCRAEITAYVDECGLRKAVIFDYMREMMAQVAFQPDVQEMIDDGVYEDCEGDAIRELIDEFTDLYQPG